jgi:hypothetical protein
MVQRRPSGIDRRLGSNRLTRLSLARQAAPGYTSTLLKQHFSSLVKSDTPSLAKKIRQACINYVVKVDIWTSVSALAPYFTPTFVQHVIGVGLKC